MKVDYARPSTWLRYKKGMCEGCSAGCCHLPVEVNAMDLVRLELTTEFDIAQSLNGVAKKLIKSRIVRSFHQKTQIFILEQKADNSCIFLGKNALCTVYERRPNVCRQFPKIGPRPGFCPCNTIRKKTT